MVGEKKKQFVDKQGKKVDFYSLVFVIDGDIWEVNTTDEAKYLELLEHMDKEVEITFSLLKGYNGKVRLTV